MGRKDSRNMHENYLDLDVEKKAKQEAERKARIARLTRMWRRTKDSLIEYNEFMERVKAGNRPTLAELRTLNRFQFKGYEKIVQDETKQMSDLLMKVLNDIKEADDEITHLMMQIDDTECFYGGLEQEIDKKIQKMIDDSGIRKVTEFDEFNFILDQSCISCRHNKFC